VTNETMAPEDQELQEPTPAHRRIQRPTRTTTPLERPGPIEIPSPPTLGAEISPTPFQFLLPVVGALTSVVMMVVMRNGQPLFMLIAAVVFTVALVSGLGFAISSRGRAGKQLRLHRSRYLDYLERTRDKLREQAEHARNTALALHPSPAGLVSFIHDPERLWERRRSDADHLQARIGMATVPWFTLNVPTSESPVEPIDPILLREAEMLTGSHSSIEAMPAHADLGVLPQRRDHTLILLMGVSRLRDSVTSLLEAGSDPATPAAIIERGYHPDQRVTTTELRCLADVAARYGVTAPAVIVIGDVVTLSPYWADRVVEEVRPASPAA